MLLEKITELAHAEWPAQILFAPRKNGPLHSCVGYRKIDSIIKRDLNSILCIGDFIIFIEKATVFFNLNANNDYWKAEVEETLSIRNDTKEMHYAKLTYIKASPGIGIARCEGLRIYQ